MYEIGAFYKPRFSTKTEAITNKNQIVYVQSVCVCVTAESKSSGQMLSFFI